MSSPITFEDHKIHFIITFPPVDEVVAYMKRRGVTVEHVGNGEYIGRWDTLEAFEAEMVRDGRVLRDGKWHER